MSRPWPIRDFEKVETWCWEVSVSKTVETFATPSQVSLSSSWRTRSSDVWIELRRMFVHSCLKPRSVHVGNQIWFKSSQHWNVRTEDGSVATLHWFKNYLQNHQQGFDGKIVIACNKNFDTFKPLVHCCVSETLASVKFTQKYSKRLDAWPFRWRILEHFFDFLLTKCAKMNSEVGMKMVVWSVRTLNRSGHFRTWHDDLWNN